MGALFDDTPIFHHEDGRIARAASTTSASIASSFPCLMLPKTFPEKSLGCWRT
jgi:hypothetical protein